jgi:iron complex transport system ATP-binding protein
MPHPILHLSHVNVARGRNTVLHDIHLTLYPGEHLAILGPNGCGKSTLLKTLTCELYPLVQPGTEVELFGRKRWDLTQLKKRLGVVSPDLPGKPTLATTGFNAILTGFFSSSTLWPNLTVTAAMRDRAEEVLHEVDAAPMRDKLVGEMSAGQQRRIMIGRALVGTRDAAATHQAGALRVAAQEGSMKELSNPDGSAGEGTAQRVEASATSAEGNATDVLLLDEPSNALDLSAQRELQRLLRKLAGQGTSLLLITHQIADIIPEIGRVLMMRDGRIVADGPKADLLTAPKLSELFATEVHLTERNGFYQAS